MAVFSDLMQKNCNKLTDFMSNLSASTFWLNYNFSEFKQRFKFYVLSLLINSSRKVLDIFIFCPTPNSTVITDFPVICGTREVWMGSLSS